MEASRRRAAFVLLIAFALALAACSSGDDTTTTAAATTTGESTTTSAGSETTTTTDATTPTTSDAAGARVIINDFSFNPGDITVSAGSTVTWDNGDGVSHTTTSDDDVWDSGSLGSGDTFEVVFDEPGVYAYHCNIHRTMTGTVTVEG